MKITIVYRYFWPDTPPYAAMLRDMAAWFSNAGHDVEIITAQPAYKPEAGIPRQPRREIRNGIKIRRLPLLPEHGRGFVKLLNGALFILQAFFIILFGRRRDLVWTATIPPVVQAAAILAAGRIRGAATLYHMQDIYPEIAEVSGLMKNALAAKVLRAIDNHTLKRASAVVVLSSDMENSIRERVGSEATISVINNFAFSIGEPVPDKAPPTAQNSNPSFRFVFAGNIGRFQNLEILVDAFGRLDGTKAVLEIVGEGRVKQKLQAIVAERNYQNIRFHQHMSSSEVSQFMESCDVGIVSLSPGLYRYAFPSKTWTYMAAGLPMLALVEEDSALAQIITDNQFGIAVPQTIDAEGLAKAVTEIMEQVGLDNLRNPKDSLLYRPETAQADWLQLIETIDPSQQPGPAT